MRYWTLLLAAPLLSAQVEWTMRNLPDTGQTRHFADGDDADYSIHPPALTRNDDGTVMDYVTGLQWQRSDSDEMKWDRAKDYCASLDSGGFKDWRLPTNRELFTIMNHNNPPRAIDANVFARSEAEYWWSSDLLAGDPSRAWVVNAGGGSGPHPQSETLSAGGDRRYQVRCVRQTESRMVDTPFTTNGDGTVTDLRTGLIWQEAEAENALSWEQALLYVRSLDLAGATDWRLPNVKELQSIHDETATRPAIATMYFPTTRVAVYWTSTTLINREGDRAWTVDFNLGIVSYNPKTDRLRVRAVRGGTDPTQANQP